MLERPRNQAGLETLLFGVIAGFLAIIVIIYVGYLFADTFVFNTNSNSESVTVSDNTATGLLSYSDFTDAMAQIEITGALPLNEFELAEYYRYLDSLLLNGDIGTEQFQNYQNTLNSVVPFEGNRDVAYAEFINVLDHIEIYGALPANAAHNQAAYYSYLNTLILNNTITMAQFQNYLNILNLSGNPDIEHVVADMQVQTVLAPETIDTELTVSSIDNPVAEHNEIVLAFEDIRRYGVFLDGGRMDYYNWLVTDYVNGIITREEFNMYLNILNNIEPFRAAPAVTYTDFMDMIYYIQLYGAFPADSEYIAPVSDTLAMDYACTRGNYAPACEGGNIRNVFAAEDYYNYLHYLAVNSAITLEQYMTYYEALYAVAPIYDENRVYP